MSIRRATLAISVEDRCVVAQMRISSHDPMPGIGDEEPSPARAAITRPTGMPTATTNSTMTAPVKRSQEPAGR